VRQLAGRGGETSPSIDGAFRRPESAVETARTSRPLASGLTAAMQRLESSFLAAASLLWAMPRHELKTAVAVVKSSLAVAQYAAAHDGRVPGPASR